MQERCCRQRMRPPAWRPLEKLRERTPQPPAQRECQLWQGGPVAAQARRCPLGRCSPWWLELPPPGHLPALQP